MFIIREESSDVENEEDLSKLITFMIDSEKVGCIHLFGVYINIQTSQDYQ